MRFSARALPAALLLLLALCCAPPPAAQAEPVRQLRVMAFNVWWGGRKINDGLDKIVAAVVESGADVVAMQESNGAAAGIARRLDWYAYQPAHSVAIASRYPITTVFAPSLRKNGAGVRIRLSDDPPQDIVVWSVHLTAFPYGPYEACYRAADPDAVMGTEMAYRFKQIYSVLQAMKLYHGAEPELPIFLAGDFNTPSHLDWTEELAGRNCGYAIRYPVTDAIATAGFTDAYRAIHPDPGSHPGLTWSPIFPKHDHELVVDLPEPQDRIDYVFYKGAGVTPTDARVFVTGHPADFPNHKANEWPSDHAAVIVDFELAPGRWR